MMALHFSTPTSPRMRLQPLLLRPRLSTILALVSFVLIVVRAVLTVDPIWDTLQYHWPFAGRLSGMCDRNCFLLSGGLEARYDGFPLLMNALQGLLWRLTGTPGMADLINIAMVVALMTYLRWRFCVPLAWSWLAFLAIPEVQIELTTSLIDLPVNTAVTLAIVVVLRMLVQPNVDQRADVGIALVALAVATGSKFQIVPIALVTWFAIVTLARRNPSSVGFTRRLPLVVSLSLVGALALLPKLAINALAFGNPFYPIAVRFGPFQFPGLEPMISGNAISDVWATWPNPVRWVISVLEYDAFHSRWLPWTIGQGEVPQSSPSFRMGGYFVSYVLGAITLIVWSARTTPLARWVLAMVISLSFICAWTPLSHDLRYNEYWMLALVSLALVIVHSPAFAGPQQAANRGATHALIAIAATSVVMMTGGAYLRTNGFRLEDLTRETNAVVAGVPEGGTLCILNSDRRGFLYSSVFHPPRHYLTRTLFADEQAECTIRLDLQR